MFILRHAVSASLSFDLDFSSNRSRHIYIYNSHSVSKGMVRYANRGHKSGEGPPVISLESRDGGTNDSIYQSTLILIGRYIYHL